MILTRCKFYYGHTITEANRYIDFQEGANPKTFAKIDIGEYSLTDFCSKVAQALNSVGAINYTCSVNRTTRIITVTGDSSFKLLPSTGDNTTRSVFSLLGFSADTSLATSQVATSASGSVWSPQFLPQDSVDFEDCQSAIDGVVKQSASGKVESVRYGTKKIAEMNFKFITDIYQPSSSPIANDQTGISSARSFMVYAVTKADLEYIPDADYPSTFTKCVLESTPEDSNGMGFKLKEDYGSGLVGYYSTGILKFRKL
jgi:hypothetical protein